MQRIYPLLFVFLWSTGFIGAKYGLPYAEPLSFLFVRYLAVIALMTAITFWKANQLSVYQANNMHAFALIRSASSSKVSTLSIALPSSKTLPFPSPIKGCAALSALSVQAKF